MAERLLALTSRKYNLVILKGRMDDPSLIRVHRLKSHGTSRSLNLVCNVLCQGFQRFLPSLPVILRIQLHAEILFRLLVYHEAHKVLEGIQRLSPLSDQKPHLVAG